MELASAIEVFVRGFCVDKSVAHPYVPERIDGLWILRDGPGRKNPRKIEVVTSGLPAAAVVDRIRKIGLGWHFACEVHSSEEDYESIRQAYKDSGYRALSTEWLFHSDLSDIPHFQSNPPVRLVPTQAEADAIRQVAAHKFKLTPGRHLFAAWDKTRDYGSVWSIPVGSTAWVAALYVHRDARGRGFGRALMSTLMQSAKASGIKDSVLVASSDGARLYPHLGYRRIGTLQIFCPAERG